MSAVPNGWHDDGHTLRAPDGTPVVLGFRDFILNYPTTHGRIWDAGNVPKGPQYSLPQLEAMNAALGGGDQQMFQFSMLGYPHNPTGAYAAMKDTVIEEWLGAELLFTRQQYSALFGAYQKVLAGGGTPQVPAEVKAAASRIVAWLATL